MVEGALDTMFGDNPKAFGEAFGVTLDAMSPSILSGAWGAPIEIAANKDFFRGAPLVSRSLENLRPEDQLNPYTSETARRIGKLFGISPIYVEHLAEGWTGGMATESVKALEATAGLATRKSPRQVAGGLSTVPIVGRLFLSPTHTRVLSDFYAARDAARKDYGSARLHGEETSPPTELERAARKINALRDESRGILDDKSLSEDQRRDRFVRLHQQMIDIAKSAMQKK